MTIQHLGSSITLRQLASLVGLKVHDLLIAFRETFGTTPAQYIIEQRLRRARWLLVNTPQGITDIAIETGFSSQAHLATVFRDRVGVTPKDFRASELKLQRQLH